MNATMSHMYTYMYTLVCVYTCTYLCVSYCKERKRTMAKEIVKVSTWEREKNLVGGKEKAHPKDALQQGGNKKQCPKRKEGDSTDGKEKDKPSGCIA